MVDGLENTVQKGRAFELLTKCFLQLDPKYATILKNVWHHNANEVPPDILKRLNLPEPDEGIDILAETYEGKFWAIQCKYLADESQSIGRTKLSTFTDLSFTIAKGISLGLICTPLDRFSYKLDKYYGDRISYCAGENYRDIGEEFFQRANALLQGNRKAIEAYKPRSHQERAITNAVEHYVELDERRGKMIMPCGSGKSLTAYWIAYELSAKRILIALPSLSLVRQTLEVWARESLANGRDVRWICVCSDSTVKEASSDDNSVLVQDLGVKVENNPQEIADWLSKSGNSTSVVFTTYQSGQVTSEASRLAGITYDLGIFDEAHKTVGKKEQLFPHMLFNENVSIHKRLFMTATERQYRGDSEDILSMDDPEIYGDTFELLTFKEALAIRPPILSDYKIVTLAVTTDEIKELLQANVFVRPEKGKVDEKVEAKMLAAALQLRKTMLNYPLKHCISFHSSIARAVAFQKTQENINNKFPKYNKLDCFHIQGSMPTSLRKRYMDEAIKSPQSLVTNARCLTEGVDVKQIDGVLFADPKGSTIDIVQSAGRAFRPNKDKEFGYILVPIILDSDKLRERIEQNEAYSDILIAIRALASSDDRIIDYFKSVATGESYNKENSPLIFSVSESSEINLEEFANDVCLKLWDKLAKLSLMPFEEARVFARSLNLKSLSDWKRFCSRKPADIPSSPDSTYADKGWLGWSDWLGNKTASPQKRNWREFEKARSFVQGLKIGSRVGWISYSRGRTSIKPSLPSDIPSSPNIAYKNLGWKGYGDWLGTGKIGTRTAKRKKWRNFADAREYARSLNLMSSYDWNNFSKGLIDGLIRPDDIPSNPRQTYAKEGWINWTDWLQGQDESQKPANKWSNIVDFLEEFKKKRGHFKMPATKEFQELKDWIQKVRSQKAKGQLNPQLQEMLEQINFDWGE